MAHKTFPAVAPMTSLTSSPIPPHSLAHSSPEHQSSLRFLRHSRQVPPRICQGQSFQETEDPLKLSH